MKKVLVTFVLALTTAAMAQGNSQGNSQSQGGVTAKGATVQVTSEPNQPQQQQGQQPAQSTGQTQGSGQGTGGKVIKDQAEFNAYMTAFGQQDPAQKAQAMEAFVAQYPNSIVKLDALEQAMGAYQQLQNQAKVEDTAKRILQIDPNHVRALAIVTYIDRTKATQNNPDALKSTCDEAQRGLQSLPSLQKPEGMSDADFQKQRTQINAIFEGAAGFCALQAKNFAEAKQHYTNSLKLDPTNFTDTFQLAVADLSGTPQDLDGFYYCARAMNLAQSQNNAAGAQAINNQFCKPMYHNYHGKDEGWDQFVQQFGAQPAPPANLAQVITPKPTACDIAVDAVKNNPPGDLSFSDKEFVLAQKGCSPAGTEAADKVWQSILDLQTVNGKPAKLNLPIKVISATPDTIQGAVSDDNQQANKADITITMEKPMAKPPAPGSNTNVIGNITSYTPNPFMFTMEKASLAAAKEAPTTKSTKGKKTATRKKK